MSEYIFKRARLLGKDVVDVHVLDGMIAAVSSDEISSASATVDDASWFCPGSWIRTRICASPALRTPRPS